MEDFREVMAMEGLEFREDGEGEERKLRENEMKREKVKLVNVWLMKLQDIYEMCLGELMGWIRVLMSCQNECQVGQEGIFKYMCECWPN